MEKLFKMFCAIVQPVLERRAKDSGQYFGVEIACDFEENSCWAVLFENDRQIGKKFFFADGANVDEDSVKRAIDWVDEETSIYKSAKEFAHQVRALQWVGCSLSIRDGVLIVERDGAVVSTVRVEKE